MRRPLLCHECRRELVPPAVARCGRCAARTGLPTSREVGCPLCTAYPLRFDRVLTIGSYDAALREAVLRMKHWRGESLTIAMAELLVECLETELRALAIDVVVPVPMHWWRRLRRTTNSADLLAEVVARHLGKPWHPRLVTRRRSTEPQHLLSPGQRRRNVRGAFRTSPRLNWRGASALLVDDILTTGSTCSEIARLLKHSGAAEVNVLVVARAQGEL
ncbi:MAG TPA: ComF family protein [Pirellulales bacterium]|nr:ComF family protein [Pirellulales bacterium]